MSNHELSLEELKKRILVINLKNLEYARYENYEEEVFEFPETIDIKYLDFITNFKIHQFEGSGELFKSPEHLIMKYYESRQQLDDPDILLKMIRDEYKIIHDDDKFEYIETLRKLVAELEADYLSKA